MPGNFVICHKDARIRHLLYDENLGEKPYLIDREFANISDGAQDLAKIIYDLHINHNIDLVRAYHDVISQYEVHISNKALLYNLKNRILSFLYIIPFERLGGLISQKKE
jgi:thiamine kinase-like enzyme